MAFSVLPKAFCNFPTGIFHCVIVVTVAIKCRNTKYEYLGRYEMVQGPLRREGKCKYEVY